MADYVKDLIEYLKESPSPYHAVEATKIRLKQAGFLELEEGKPWKLAKGKGYFVTRNGSALCAFVTPNKGFERSVILTGHTDSPGFKVKPFPEKTVENMQMLTCEVYGGPLLSSWLNRELGIAGRATYMNKKNALETKLLNENGMRLTIPELAIHLNREVNQLGLKLDKQEHIPALCGLNSKLPKNKGFLETLFKKHLKMDQVEAFDLFLYPIESPQRLGIQEELIASYRIDNLASCHSGIASLIESKKASNSLLKAVVLFDHEEVGSETAQGAGSTFLKQTLERIQIGMKMSREEMLIALSKSLCVSVDMAHALHPNYPLMHEQSHRPLLGEGIVLKVSAQQRYATESPNSAEISRACKLAKVKMQSFVIRTDLPCGSTVGPIVATRLGIPTVDIGCPQLSMHGARELFAAQDHLDMIAVGKQLFSQ